MTKTIRHQYWYHAEYPVTEGARQLSEYGLKTEHTWVFEEGDYQAGSYLCILVHYFSTHNHETRLPLVIILDRLSPGPPIMDGIVVETTFLYFDPKGQGNFLGRENYAFAAPVLPESVAFDSSLIVCGVDGQDITSKIQERLVCLPDTSFLADLVSEQDVESPFSNAGEILEKTKCSSLPELFAKPSHVYDQLQKNLAKLSNTIHFPDAVHGQLIQLLMSQRFSRV